ncbi:hypothetical protein EV1_042787 [Malus domestica]
MPYVEKLAFFDWLTWNRLNHLRSLNGPPHNVASSLSVIDKEQSQEPMDVNLVRRSGPSKEEQESIREDGELPSLVPAASVVNENTLSHHKGANLDHSRRLS